tara:strand:- start:3340 stop:4896 length:1557 start_codon:yes stop_codon:yes gene_type:complete
MNTVDARMAVLWCPDWPVVAHARAERLSPGEPIILIDKGVVFAANQPARAEGVRRGMRQREAQSRCAAVHVLAYDRSLDARAFEPVLTALEQSVPGWHPLRPGLVAVRARGVARYYGGERAAARTLLTIAEGLELPAAVGIADGLFAAELAARRTPIDERTRIVPAGEAAAFLAPLPITLIDDAELVSLLPRLGIRTLGGFAELTAFDVASRFGENGACWHALARGRDARAATPRIPPRDLDAVVDFEPPLERIDQVAFGMRVAADDFVAALLAETLVCTALRVEFTGEDGETSERVWLHPRSFAPAEVVDRIRWSLEAQTGSDRDHGLRSPVARVRLAPESVDPVGAHERGLWGSGPEEQVHSVLSRVQGMVGHAGVVTATREGGRSPAERQTLVPWGDRPVVRRDVRRPWPGAVPPPAPATVYEVPRPLRVEDARGRPVAVDARGTLSASPAVLVSQTGARRDLTAWAGPWPLDERWWDQAAARRTQRFQAVDTAGEAWLLELDEAGEWWAAGRYD